MLCSEYAAGVAGHETTAELFVRSIASLGEEFTMDTSSTKKENAAVAEKPSKPIITFVRLPFAVRSKLAETSAQVVEKLAVAIGLT